MISYFGIGHQTTIIHEIAALRHVCWSTSKDKMQINKLSYFAYLGLLIFFKLLEIFYQV